MVDPTPDFLYDLSSFLCGFETFIKRNNNLAGPSRFSMLPHVFLSAADKQLNENLKREAAPDLIRVRKRIKPCM